MQKLPQMIGYVKTFEGNTIIFLKISNKQLLKKIQPDMEKSLKFIKHKI